MPSYDDVMQQAPSYDDVMQQGITNLSFQCSTISVIGDQEGPPTYAESIANPVTGSNIENLPSAWGPLSGGNSDTTAAAQPVDIEIG